LSSSSPVGRIAAILALVGALVVVLLLLLGGGDTYKVTGHFQNASQLVKGNNVTVAGVSVGKVADIKLGDDGEALVEMDIKDSDYTPLKQGTTATVRSQSLSGVANRYVDLSLPPADKTGGQIDSGGEIDQQNTVSEVDLDQLFNTLDKPTIAGLQGVIKGFARSYDGVGAQANQGFYYFNPFLSTSRRVFGELNRDQPALESLIVDGASLTSALAAKSGDIDTLVNGGQKTLQAIGSQNRQLASAIGQLPDFMRQFNTTSFNLRAALDDVDPLINASKPVVKELKPFTKNLRGFAHGAVPAVDDLDHIVSKPGTDNDLTELTQLLTPVGQIASGPVDRNGASRPGALPAAASALKDGLPQLSFLRPYVTVEGVSGWFDDFGHSGVYDANGGVARIVPAANLFTLGLNGLPNISLGSILNQDDLSAIPGLDVGNNARCPGSNERGSTDAQLTYNGTIDCDPNQVPPGP
jgi:phospholipid/cholesterol/gamma-HCH transport system substrate-binding protein